MQCSQLHIYFFLTSSMKQHYSGAVPQNLKLCEWMNFVLPSGVMQHCSSAPPSHLILCVLPSHLMWWFCGHATPWHLKLCMCVALISGKTVCVVSSHLLEQETNFICLFVLCSSSAITGLPLPFSCMQAGRTGVVTNEWFIHRKNLYVHLYEL